MFLKPNRASENDAVLVAFVEFRNAVFERRRLNVQFTILLIAFSANEFNVSACIICRFKILYNSLRILLNT